MHKQKPIKIQILLTAFLLFFSTLFFTSNSYAQNVLDFGKKSSEQKDSVPGDDEAISFATGAVITAFNYSYENYYLRLKMLSAYFTPQGWQNFTNNLRASKSLNIMLDEKITIEGEAGTFAKIVNKGTQENKSPYWDLIMPIHVNYTNANKKQTSEDYIVELTVLMVPKNVNSQGLGITSFEIKPKS